MESFEYSFEPLGDKLRICVTKEHKFGTDAFLLSHFANPKNGSTVCDLGSGCGIIPLLWFRRPKPPKAAFAVELMPKGAAQMKITVEENKLQDCFFPLNMDLKELRNHFENGRFDLVTCNPPYKAVGTGIPCPGDVRLTARHEVSCTLGDVCTTAAWLLRFGGSLCLCQRPERLPDVMEAMRNAGIEPKRLRFVQQHPHTPPWLFLIEGKKGSKPFLQVEAPLIVEAPEGGFSKEMLDIYGIYPEGRNAK